MAWVGKVDPITLGGEPVESLESITMAGFDKPEPDSSDVSPEIDWAPIFAAGAFTPAEVQYLLAHRLSGLSRRAVCLNLSWTRRRFDQVAGGAEVKLSSLIGRVREQFATDFVGGNSRSLSFRRSVPGGQVWNLTKLDKSFREIIGTERVTTQNGGNVPQKRTRKRSLVAHK